MSVFRNLLDKQRNPKPLAHYNFEGYTNTDHPDKIPNLTGKGYNLSYYNIDFKLMSGFEGYADDWTRYPVRLPSTTDHASSIKDSIAIYNNWFWGSNSFQPGESIPEQIIMVSGMDPDASYVLRYNNTDETLDIKEDGIYILPGATYTGESPLTGVGLYIYNPQEELIHSVTVQQLPLYPGCAVFGETEETGLICNSNMQQHFSVGKGFTVICQRYIENIGRTSYIYYSGDAQVNRVFQEYVNNIPNSEATVYSFGEYSYADLKMAGIVPYTSTMYDGAGIQKGDTLNIMRIYLGMVRSFRGGMKEFYLFNRDLTQAQIERFISENMVPDPLAYYDVRKQNTKNSDTHSRGTLIDLSGNGNHGVLNSFDYNASLNRTYLEDVNSFILANTSGSKPIERNGYSVSVVLSIDATQWLWWNSIDTSSGSYTTKEYTIKVTGITQGAIEVIPWGINIGGNYTYSDRIRIEHDGVYTIPSVSYEVPEGCSQHLQNLVVAAEALNSGVTVEYLPRPVRQDGDGWVETYIDDEYPMILTNLAGECTYAGHILYINNIGKDGWMLTAEKRTGSYGVKPFRIKVTGLTSGNIQIRNDYSLQESLTQVIRADGIYEAKGFYLNVDEDVQSYPIVVSVSPDISNGCTVEFLPQTDYIQFDGVKDFINIPSLAEGFKTICMLTEGPDINVRLYDQRATTDQKYFALFSSDVTIAYNALSTGQTYINGELNTSTHPSDLKGDKICIIHRNDGVTPENSSTPYIGVKYTGKYNGPIKLSKFLGFREYLSDTQIKKVIEKYGLLEGISNGSKVSVNTDELTFGSEGGSQQIQITSNDSWTIS